MSLDYHAPAVIPVLISAGLLIYALLRTWRSRRERVAPWLLATIVILLAWAVGLVFELMSNRLQDKLLCANLEFIAIMCLPLAWLLTLRRIVDARAPRRWWQASGWVITALFVAMVFVNPGHLFRGEPSIAIVNGERALNYDYQALFFFGFVPWAAALLVASAILLIRGMSHTPSIFRRRNQVLLAASLVPMVGLAIYLSDTLPWRGFDPTFLCVSVAVLLCGLAVLRYKVLDVAPLGRDALIENLGGGIVVLDTDERIIDFNRAARAICPALDREAIGCPVAEVLHDQPVITEALRSSGSSDSKGAGMPDSVSEDATLVVEVDERNSAARAGQRHFAVSIAPVYDRRQERVGSAIILFDVTRRMELFSALADSRGQLAEKSESLAAALAELEQRHVELETSHARLRRLQEATSALGSNLEPDLVLARVGTALLDLMEADGVWLLTVDAESRCLQGQLMVASASAPKLPLLSLFGASRADEGLPLAVEGSALTEAAVHQRPTFIADLQCVDSEQLKTIVGGTATTSGIRALALVPLVADDEPVGVAVVAKDHVDEMAEGMRTMTSLFARQAALTIKNSNLYGQVKRSSELDPLTGLYNHRVLHDVLERELARADRYGHEVCVMMADLNGFKLFNDTYGHPAGDVILKQVARQLHRTCRASDIAGRYGGDEFLLVLPETDREGAVTLAQHLCSALVNEPYDAQDGRRLPVRLSVGIACYPGDGAGVSALVAAADAGMYESKRRGGGVFTATEAGPMPSSFGAFPILEGLVTAVDNLDSYTRRHSEEVASLSAEIAVAWGLPENLRRALHIAAMLHDIGKIGVPMQVLRKPGRLTSEEYGAVKQHAMLGEIITQQLPDLEVIRAAIGSHHERYDGTGYPRGLSGDEIPLLGRILAIADAYSAMTTDRPYRAALSVESAAAEIEDNAGTQFDPDLMRAFLSTLELPALQHR